MKEATATPTTNKVSINATKSSIKTRTASKIDESEMKISDYIASNDINDVNNEKCQADHEKDTETSTTNTVSTKTSLPPNSATLPTQ